MLDSSTPIALWCGTSNVRPSTGVVARKYTGPRWFAPGSAVAVSLGLSGSGIEYDHCHQASAQSSMLRPNGRASNGNSAGLGLWHSFRASADACSVVSSDATQPPRPSARVAIAALVNVLAVVVLMGSSASDLRGMAVARLPTIIYFLPMRRRVVLIGYDGADGLDLFGPAEVFAATCRRLGAPAYDVIVAAIGGGAIALTSGAAVVARELGAIRPHASDTVLVAGGADRAIAVASANPALTRWLVRAAR